MQQENEQLKRFHSLGGGGDGSLQALSCTEGNGSLCLCLGFLGILDTRGRCWLGGGWGEGGPGDRML